MHFARAVAGTVKIASNAESRAACLAPRRQVGRAHAADGECRDFARQHIPQRLQVGREIGRASCGGRL